VTITGGTGARFPHASVGRLGRPPLCLCTFFNVRAKGHQAQLSELGTMLGLHNALELVRPEQKKPSAVSAIARQHSAMRNNAFLRFGYFCSVPPGGCVDVCSETWRAVVSAICALATSRGLRSFGSLSSKLMLDLVHYVLEVLSFWKYSKYFVVLEVLSHDDA
jgi:hypothetical protein